MGRPARSWNLLPNVCASNPPAVEVQEAGGAGDIDPADFDATIVASSMQMGAYRPAVIRFVRRSSGGADRQAVGVRVGLDGGGEHAPSQRGDGGNSEVGWRGSAKRPAGRQLGSSTWLAGCRTPGTISSPAGSCGASRAKEGNATDTTRDHEYTDWEALARFADVVRSLAQGENPGGGRGVSASCAP